MARWRIPKKASGSKRLLFLEKKKQKNVVRSETARPTARLSHKNFVSFSEKEDFCCCLPCSALPRDSFGEDEIGASGRCYPYFLSHRIDQISGQGCKMIGRYNEGRAIDAVIRRIEVRDQLRRMGDGWSPDESLDPDPLKRVDYVCTIGTRLHAFEHTGIQPFSGQIDAELRNSKFFGPIETEFDRRNDREFWELFVPVDATEGFRGGDFNRVRKRLRDWIEQSAVGLSVSRMYDRYLTQPLGMTDASVPFPFSLHRLSLDQADFPTGNPLNGRFMVKYIVRGNLEKARIVRIRKALEEKSPKLHAWKQGAGSTIPSFRLCKQSIELAGL